MASHIHLNKFPSKVLPLYLTGRQSIESDLESIIYLLKISRKLLFVDYL